MKRFACLGGWGEFTPEDPNVKDGYMCLFYSRKDEKLHIGKFFNSDESGSLGFFDYFTGKRYYPYTSEVISLVNATLEDVEVSLNPVRHKK